ncbi:Fe superoxide dismutase-like protein [Aaosphaeria arxii CBS 175.79]|uniref:Fe superoxide dismutase-like protein n=1 Tax=Aaosphaeria arxii CBS 175.79 TaxID=1450172 RepID=A0A6A5XU25_9PLEO|nr:Fe superoxide dismutase-like protein [Aaosphaeria arxii CBS 175.79]KAF2015744.1 Fe superoxide dismutase-like protein [Aaosphaeria arxii CBS 175.79]
MIIRTLLRRPGAIQSRTAAPARSFSPAIARYIHRRATLANHEQLSKNGIPGLFSPKGFSIAYDQYQQHITDELNATTSGTPFENKDVKDLVIEWSRNPTTAYGFNVASMAYNNHFFFSGISKDPNVQSTPPSELATAINNNFSSFESLREEFLATADAMFGPGFVWLVQTNDTSLRPLRILPTYLAGTPISGAHYRRQSHDLNTHSAESFQQLNNVGTFGQAAKQDNRPKKPLGGIDVVPLLCVSTWEHAWLHDYGVKGKSKYLQAWWNKIDWNTVSSLGQFTKSDQSVQVNKFFT